MSVHKNKSFTLYEPYKITWQDAWSTDDVWQDPQEVQRWAELSVNNTIGYLVYEDKKHMVFAQSVCVIEKKFSTLTGIPRACIIKMEKVK